MFIVLSVKGLASEHAAGLSGSGGVAKFHFDRRRITDEKPPHRLVFDWPEEDGVSGGWRLHLDMLETVPQGGRGGPLWGPVEGLEAGYDERHG